MLAPACSLPGAVATEMDKQLTSSTNASNLDRNGHLREFCEKMAMCQETDCMALVFDELPNPRIIALDLEGDLKLRGSIELLNLKGLWS